MSDRIEPVRRRGPAAPALVAPLRDADDERERERRRRRPPRPRAGGGATPAVTQDADGHLRVDVRA